MDKLLGSLKSKTAWFSLILIVLAALTGNVEAVQEVFKDNSGTVLSVIGVVSYILRLLTTKPLESK